MSTPSGRLAACLTGLYPAAWRARYEPEMLALIEDDPPSLRAIGSLLLGAADAHIHPRSAWRSELAPTVRLRLSVCALFGCWLVMALLGMGFQKETEERRFAVASAHHMLLGAAHWAIIAGAAIGALAISVGGLPLLARALARAVTTRDRRLLALLAAPPAAIAAFMLLTLVLLVVAPSRGGGFPAGFVLMIVVPWQLAALACAGVCAWSPRVVLSRVEVPAAALRRAARAGTVLTGAMVILTAALALYAACIWLQAPQLSGISSGPFGAGTAAMLSGQAVAAGLATAIALSVAGRARSAATEAR
ncbi:MAG TPA: hypothetical protein VII01_10990 [Solirubrobacteraceae bacterium]|jgi:hypothetical protein